MNILEAFSILLLGLGLGALLMWVQQTAARRQFRQQLETQVDQALFGGLRRQGCLRSAKRVSHTVGERRIAEEGLDSLRIVAPED